MVASKANGKAEPEKPNNVEIEIPDNLEEHVEPVDGAEMSCGQKCRGLNQDDGWKVPKQMHNWNIRSWTGLIVVIVALVAISNYYGSTEPPRFTRDVYKNNSAQSFDSIHHKSAMLARLMNGIYLQNELTDGSFPTYDFVAEAGGIGDPSMINKFISLKAKDAVKRMESIRGFELIKPEGVEDKLNTLSKFTAAKPPKVLDKTQSDALFSSLRTIKTTVTTVFAETEIDAVLQKLKLLDTDLAKGTTDGADLSGVLGEVGSAGEAFGRKFVKNGLPDFIADLPLSKLQEPAKTLKLFEEKVALYNELLRAYPEMILLSTSLYDVKEQSQVLDPFMAGKENAHTLITLNSLLDFLKSVDDHLTPKLLIGFPIGFTNYSSFFENINDGWLKKVLNEKHDLTMLTTSLMALTNATKEVDTVVNSWNSGTRPALIQGISDDCKKLNQMMAINPKSETVSPSVVKIETLIDSLKSVLPFADMSKLSDMLTKLQELIAAVDDLLKNADALQKDAQLQFFIGKDLLQLRNKVKIETEPVKAAKIVNDDAELNDFRANAQAAKTKMKNVNSKVHSINTILTDFSGFQSTVNIALTWLADNGQKDFYDMIPAVNEDIVIVKRMLDLAPKVALNYRRKRDTSVQLMELADQLAKLGPLKATVDKLKDPSNKNKKTMELKKLSSARQMAAELAYAAGALNAYIAIQNNQADIKTISDFAKTVDAEIAKLPPKDQAEVRVGWPGADKVTATFTALQPQVKKLPPALDKVKADATLNDFAEVLTILDKVPVMKLDVTAILKSLELLKTKSNNAKAVVDVSAALKKFEGLSFASGRKKGALPPMVKKMHAFFFDFFGLVLPTTTETPPTAVPFFLIIFFIAAPPGGIWLFLWFRWIQKMKRAIKDEPKKSAKDENPVKTKSEAKSAKESVKEPVVEPVKESASEVPEEDGPVAVKEEERKTTEQQEDASAINEKRLTVAGKKLDEKAKWANSDKRRWRHENRMKEQKAKIIYTVDKKHKSYWKRRSDLKAYHNWIVRLKQSIADVEAKEVELRKEIAYNRTVDKWKAMLAANKDEIEVKKQDYKKMVDEE